MSYYIFVFEYYRLDSLDVLRQFHSTDKSGVLSVRKVDLTGVTCDDEFGIAAHSCEEHLQLAEIRVLSLIEYDTCPVESSYLAYLGGVGVYF